MTQDIIEQKKISKNDERRERLEVVNASNRLSELGSRKQPVQLSEGKNISPDAAGFDHPTIGMRSPKSRFEEGTRVSHGIREDVQPEIRGRRGRLDDSSLAAENLTASDPESQRRLIDDQLTELSRERDQVGISYQTLAELGKVDNIKPKTGLVARRKRELEDQLEALDRQVNGLKSRLRMLTR